MDRVRIFPARQFRRKRIIALGIVGAIHIAVDLDDHQTDLVAAKIADPDYFRTSQSFPVPPADC
jgi:hypothetical protein